MVMDSLHPSSAVDQRQHSDQMAKGGQPGWFSGLALPSAQGMILETWGRVPRPAPCMEPASLSVPLCVSHE